ncbi:LAETG motif-containing sortase-dependent surface protein [Streptomyces sp. NBC_01477]|uniref:LAETG motif-containing sortase-dependent surface protein n=1 Tax=Streptomyces sp. NBC_01477 TaxID=2976015 RepID=UPI002E3811B3|nr:LAETG motif-containing sortase-dependent surface protein [Streptomyces sp. NBC_01477]
MKLTVQGRRRSAAIAAAGMAAMIGTAVLAAPASAHTPVWSVTCNSVQVDLTNYSTGRHVQNSVSLTVVGGEGALADNEDFGGSFHATEALPAHDSPLTVRLVVKAGDNKKYNVDETKVSPVCDTPTSPSVTPSTTPPTTAPETTAPGTTAPTTAPVPAGTTNAPVVAGTTSAAGGGDLAETGSSSATPMIAGIAVAVVVAGGGLVLWTRRRGSSAHR